MPSWSSSRVTYVRTCHAAKTCRPYSARSATGIAHLCGSMVPAHGLLRVGSRPVTTSGTASLHSQLQYEAYRFGPSLHLRCWRARPRVGARRPRKRCYTSAHAQIDRRRSRVGPSDTTPPHTSPHGHHVATRVLRRVASRWSSALPSGCPSSPPPTKALPVPPSRRHGASPTTGWASAAPGPRWAAGTQPRVTENPPCNRPSTHRRCGHRTRHSGWIDHDYASRRLRRYRSCCRTAAHADRLPPTQGRDTTG